MNIRRIKDEHYTFIFSLISYEGLYMDIDLVDYVHVRCEIYVGVMDEAWSEGNFVSIPS